MRRYKGLDNRKKVIKSFGLYLVGISLVACSHFSLIYLQSSLNVENGLGATCLTIVYSTALVSGLIICPIFLKFFSVRNGMILYDITALIYCAANFYPEYYTLVPASILVGFGKSLFWICSGTFVVYYAKLFQTLGKPGTENNTSTINGLVLSGIYAAQVVGNLVSFLVFREEDQSTTTGSSNKTTWETQSATVTQTIYNFKVSDVCAAKDCQNPEITERILSRYVPPQQTKVYIVMSVYLGITLIGLILHVFVVPSDHNEVTLEKKINSYDNKAFSEIKKTDFTNKNTVRDNMKTDREKFREETDVSPRSKIKDKCYEVLDELKLTFKHYVNRQQLLLMWLQIHGGMNRSFLSGEITRAYVSCIFGVAEVGVCMAIYGASTFLTALVNGKISAIYGRKIITIAGFLFNLGVYCFCLLWVPDEYSESWIAFVLLFFYGIVDGLWQPLTTGSVAVFFPENSKRAFACWQLCTSISFVIQFSWSTSLCVNAKIYVLLATLCIGVTTQIIAEYRRARELKGNIYNVQVTAL
ncbi:unnamed protein product [Clavelina lepadiformis]|uniref:Protein unc-93 homolog A n=1 Tax=Clavelina lepadiformis TaxID=159417 RepID=A0ABP0FBN0_CLALP